MSDIKVSLIIPVYNVEQYLGKCLNSAINQTLKEIEIIAVNDGSTDKSLEILEKYAQKDHRIIIVNQENQGLSGARNNAIKIAKGEFLAFLDSDDFIHLKMLENMYFKAVKENSDIVICRHQQVLKNGDIHYTSNITSGFSQEEMFKRVLSSKSSSMACDKIYKRKLFIDNNIFYPLGMYHEDVPTTYKLFYFANRIDVIEEIYYYWLRREGSISKSLQEKHINDIFEIFKLTKEFLIKEKILNKYQKEYLRRCYHFTVGLVDRILLNDNEKLNIGKMLNNVFNRIREFDLSNTNNLEILKYYDKKLYNKIDIILYIEDNYFIGKSISIGKLINELSYTKAKLLQKEIRLSKIYNSREFKALLKYYKIRDKVLPLGSKRREVVKKIIGVNSKEVKIEHKQQEVALQEDMPNQEKVYNNENKKPMLEVAMPILLNEIEAIRTLKDKFKGKRCFILGNGPSLNKCDLKLLKNEYTFGVNGIFYKTEEMGFKPTFYMVEDGHVVDDNLEKINAYDPEYKFFPSLYKEKIKNTENTYFFAADLGFYRGDHPFFEKPRFSYDFSEVGYCGQSVTYLNMQLAYYLGFTEVYLIGMDFSYQIRETDEVCGATLVSNEDDINHFHPDYFGKGKKWHDPKVHNVARSYEFAKECFEKNGRYIYNATIGGQLEIFERVDYETLFNRDNIKTDNYNDIKSISNELKMTQKQAQKKLKANSLEFENSKKHLQIVRSDSKQQVVESNKGVSIKYKSYYYLPVVPPKTIC